MLVGRAHGAAQGWKRVAAGKGADEQSILLQCEPDGEQDLGEVVGGIELADGNAQFVAARLDRHDLIEVDPIHGLERKAVAPFQFDVADQQSPLELALDERQALEDVLQRPFVEERLCSARARSRAAHRKQVAVEEVGRHGALVRRRASGDKGPVGVDRIIRAGVQHVLDFALPPRCAGCGAIVDEVHSFCPPCWTQVHFLGESGCATCGMPLEATDAELCGGCIAQPPRIQRTRSAVAYDDLSRSIALRLKYGRKVALARTMARYMAPLIRESEEPILVPVPLHRTRLWQRGFNQAALVANELAKATGYRSDPHLLRRLKRTPALKGMSLTQRRKVVAGAFKVNPAAELAGHTVVLIDDVLTTGSTANACAKALQQAGAGRVELVSWARVIKPMQLA
jgi:ComF family protein